MAGGPPCRPLWHIGDVACERHKARRLPQFGLICKIGYARAV